MTSERTIPKHPKLDSSSDYAWLRQRGQEYVQQLGGQLWTDFNLHDPGVTFLELLCYAITDLGYRTSFSIPDLLASPPTETPDHARQGFHTAREILTISPLTIRDYRKVLIDLDGIKNAWLQVLPRPSEDIPLFANCKESSLQYAPPTEHAIDIRGLCDVLVEFANDSEMGDLNSGKVQYRFGYDAGAVGRATALIELRLPSWSELEKDKGKYAEFREPGTAIASTADAIEVEFVSGNKTDDDDIKEPDQDQAFRTVVFATINVTFLKDKSDPTSATTLRFEDVPMRIWFQSAGARRALKLDDLKNAIADASPSGLLAKYHELILRADAIVESAKSQLMAHRNLCEDWARVGAIAVEDVAICADIDLEPSADIEAVLAEAYDLIEQYLSPDLRFRSLDELLAEGTPVEEIFEGPRLSNGFLDSEQVDATNLRETIYASDILNLLADIPGVEAIRNFRMSRFDDEGKQIGSFAQWELPVTPGRQPRFYAQASKFFVFKNGLPFLPNEAELNDALQVIRGRRAQPKLPGSAEDLPTPTGQWSALDEYYPIQFQLPRVYGVSEEGLPPSAGVQRLAQAKQLRAYLLFFEQMLANYLAQLANVKELFAIDNSVDKTYFTRFIDDGLLPGVNEQIYAGLDAVRLQSLAESEDEWLDRRGRFLDHLLARFAESFAEYAIMLLRHSTDKAAAEAELITKKIEFLKDLPAMTHDRAKAFDYSQPAAHCPPVSAEASTNRAGLELRIKRLLGLEPPDDRVIVVEHVLLRPRAVDDPLLSICIPEDCDTCGEEDPYSFRLTIVISGEGGVENSNIDWRRFAENAIRLESPAHLGVKICWVSSEQLDAFQAVWCAWLEELAQEPPDVPARKQTLDDLLNVFGALKSIYPPATLHDCVDGNDENRVYLDQTIITSSSDSSEP